MSSIRDQADSSRSAGSELGRCTNAWTQDTQETQETQEKNRGGWVRTEASYTERLQELSTCSGATQDLINLAVEQSGFYFDEDEERALHQSCFRLMRRLLMITDDLDELKRAVERWAKRFDFNHVDPRQAWLQAKQMRRHGENGRFNQPPSAQEVAAFVRCIDTPAGMSASHWEPEEQMLGRLCFVLQVIAGDEPFYLGCRAASELLLQCGQKVSKSSVAGLLRSFEDEGLLLRVTKGSLKKIEHQDSYGRKRMVNQASEWRWTG